MAKFNAVTEVTGSVWKILCTVGQRLDAGETVMVIESMKMEIPVLLEEAGVVKEILVEEGMPVTEGQPVAVLDAA